MAAVTGAGKPGGSGPERERHFYVALATSDQKLGTLLELLAALQLQAGQKLSTVVVCSSRDVLDSVVCSLQDNPLFIVFALHSDLTDTERNFQVSRFQRLLARTEKAGEEGSGTAGASSGGPAVGQQQPSLVLVSTDVCLRALPRDMPPLGASLLIQFELPMKKEQMHRRIGAVFGAAKERRSAARQICINFVVAGEMPVFRAVERMTHPAIILEMPVHVGEIFM